MDTTISTIPKTSLKTNTKNDDDTRANAFSEFLEKMSAACEKVSGKNVSKLEREKWGKLADLLILELESAALHTDAISSVPAFLTEVLRRKLMNNASGASKPNRTKPDVVGKNHQTGEYEIKPLDEKEREAVLLYLTEFSDGDFLEDFRKWYTPEDWGWLNEELKKKGESEINEKVEN